MSKKIVIVESPGKIKSIQSFLDPSYKVVSSYGHIRDLPTKELGVDIENGFEPTYVVDTKKKKQITQLKALCSKATLVYLASDNDREGESIAWHTKEVLGLSDAQYKRIVFQSITKAAIQQALSDPRRLNDHLIMAQQARRILDRIVGYMLSPLLWHKIKNNLSAGRVQSVAVRLIVEKERSIHAFEPQASFKIKAKFALAGGNELQAVLPKALATYEKAHTFLTLCRQATFTVKALKQTILKRSPAPPLMTSSLQQAAGQELGFSIDRTMIIAQKLYEEGKITYMRTDSLNLSQESIKEAQQVVISAYGEGYFKQRKHKNRSSSAQEAHEAIRPTSFARHVASKIRDEQRLYTLIRNRALASQMSDALVNKTSADIAISTSSQHMLAQGEVVKFPGFLVVYASENSKKAGLPPLEIGSPLSLNIMDAKESFTRPPARYTEASLVKKLEILGIGRPSTYRPIISTIQQRGYVEKTSREGKPHTYHYIMLKEGQVTNTTITELVGAEKQKLFPTSVGMVVNDFLMMHFDTIMDYEFTANTEQKLDDIAQHKLSWQKMLSVFYPPFAKRVTAVDGKQSKANIMRELGKDPATGQPVLARLSRRYGPLIQIGEFSEDEKAAKPRFANLRKGQLLDQITLEEAVNLFNLPREVGSFEGQVITAHIGRFGPYVKHNSQCFFLGKLDPYTVKQAEAIEVIETKRKMMIPIQVFKQGEITLLAGRFGPYIKVGADHVKIPRGQDPASLSLAECEKLIIAHRKKKKLRKKRVKKKK